jgi:5-methylcytosine-specific restriction endonuclease McrBC regulatory subunit McrC
MFQAATHGKKSSIRQLLATKHIANPYYADYNPVIDVSKQILRNEYANFGDRRETSAFLFDVSMLFEYFIRKLLKRKDLRFHGKTEQELGIPCGISDGNRRRKLIPDLVFEMNDHAYVFDVKYKSFDFRYGVQREDLFQLHTYAGQIANIRPLAGCGLIYPIGESRWNAQGLEKTSGLISDVFQLAGDPVPFHVVFLKIPEQGEISDDNWPKHFHAAFKRNCELFTNQLIDTIARPVFA